MFLDEPTSTAAARLGWTRTGKFVSCVWTFREHTDSPGSVMANVRPEYLKRKPGWLRKKTARSTRQHCKGFHLVVSVQKQQQQK